jgi:hypothetical protein
VSATIYLEGAASGPHSKELQVRCREAFHKLLENCGYSGRLPRLFACGSRSAVYSDFKTAHENNRAGGYVAMLIDSEDPLTNLDATWDHVRTRPGDGWIRPDSADDEQILFMTTCMETWISADRKTLRSHYGSDLQDTSLPPLVDMETRSRHEVQQKLKHATRNCSNAYEKGKRSFEILAKLEPTALELHLPSFQRIRRILDKVL